MKHQNKAIWAVAALLIILSPFLFRCKKSSTAPGSIYTQKVAGTRHWRYSYSSFMYTWDTAKKKYDTIWHSDTTLTFNYISSDSLSTWSAGSLQYLVYVPNASLNRDVETWFHNGSEGHWPGEVQILSYNRITDSLTYEALYNIAGTDWVYYKYFSP